MNKTSTAQLRAVKNYKQRHKEEQYCKTITFYKKEIDKEMFEHCKMEIQAEGITFNRYIKDCLLKFNEIKDIVKEI